MPEGSMVQCVRHFVLPRRQKADGQAVALSVPELLLKAPQ
ncbi:pyrBI operon leader peptide [Cronobacter turicensis]|nr:pyrBI operon leader peptide [Cronobacter turicensis]EKY3195311.1 pyrBI operon leader peptide [Cronobacter turicensis]ELQ6020606.1 pyrBI operon leader peptide [Cronobacter turicensis]ELQ6075085.1 pyrBI operon leader peptide [Cronobacter turicensis]ELQ6183075.1 pyrBI operon leader peptide [Cronobacter turicensis]